MTNAQAARTADTLRAAVKRQGLSGSDLADRFEQRAGWRPGPGQFARWFTGKAALITVSPDLVALAEALELDPYEVVKAAVTDAAEVSRAVAGAEHHPLDRLTPREREVLAGVKAGYDNAAIAEVLGIYPKTVSVHISACMTKLGARDRDQLRRAATPNPYQTPRCTHPNWAGEGCPACCDDCNSDRHVCPRGHLIGHRTTICPDCPDDDQE